MNAVMNPAVDISAVSDALTRVHIRLMSHPETRLYASVILLGKSEVVDTPDCPTAYTDGINKKYGAAFCSQCCTRTSTSCSSTCHATVT
jgi:hypothetical protein